MEKNLPRDLCRELTRCRNYNQGFEGRYQEGSDIFSWVLVESGGRVVPQRVFGGERAEEIEGKSEGKKGEREREQFC